MQNCWKRDFVIQSDGIYWVAYILRELGPKGRLSGKGFQPKSVGYINFESSFALAQSPTNRPFSSFFPAHRAWSYSLHQLSHFSNHPLNSNTKPFLHPQSSSPLTLKKPWLPTAGAQSSVKAMLILNLNHILLKIIWTVIAVLRLTGLLWLLRATIFLQICPSLPLLLSEGTQTSPNPPFSHISRRWFTRQQTQHAQTTFLSVPSSKWLKCRPPCPKRSPKSSEKSSRTE